MTGFVEVAGPDALRADRESVVQEAISNLFGLAAIVGDMAHGCSTGSSVDVNALCLVADQLHIVARALSRAEA